MGSFNQSEIDYSKIENCSHGYTVNPHTKQAVESYNQETGIYKLWRTRRHLMLYDTLDIFKDFAKEKKTLYANIMLLVRCTDSANMITIRKKGRSYPANSEKALMEIMHIKSDRSWDRVKQVLFDKKYPVLCKGTFEIGEQKCIRYFMNPLITIYYKGISIFCYRLFREYLKDFLSERDYATLEYWASEYNDEDDIYELDNNSAKMIYEPVVAGND